MAEGVLMFKLAFTDRAMCELKRFGVDQSIIRFGGTWPTPGDFITFPTIGGPPVTLRVVKREFIFTQHSEYPEIVVELDIPRPLAVWNAERSA